MKTAIIYARVSTPGQVENELSLPSQIEECERKAAELGATVIRRFIEEGISAKTDNRPAFQDAIAFAELNQPDYLITWKTDRFARSRIDAPLYKARLDRAGVGIVYTAQEIDRKTDSGWLLEGMYEILDEYKSRTTAADTKRSMMKNARDGYFNGGAVPLGYQVVPSPNAPKRRILAPLPHEADVVVEMFRRRAAGDGALTIAVAMNAAGTLNRKRLWTKRTVLDLLRNETVIGRVIFNRRDKSRSGNRLRPREDWIVVQSHPPIVPMDLWERVQATMPQEGQVHRDGHGHNGWAFTGLLKCGTCGGPLHIQTASGRSKSYSYYNCQKWMKYRDCESFRLRADVLEEWLLGVVLDEVFTFENLEAVIQDLNNSAGKVAMEIRRRRRELTARIAKVEERNRKLYEILELHGVGAPNLGDLSERLRANNAELKGLQAQLVDLDRAPIDQPPLTRDQVEEVRVFLAETVRTTQNYNKLRLFLRGFVQSVTVKGGEVRLEYDPRALVSPAVHSAGRWLPERNALRTGGRDSGSLNQILLLKLPPAALAQGQRGHRRGRAAA